MKKIKIFMITLLIAISSFAMVACGEKYDDFSLSFSTKQIEMSVDDKDVSYRLKIENYVEMKPTFDFYFSDNIAEISEVNDLGKGIYELVMNPLKGGTTTLTITMLEGNKTLSVPVRVVEKVKSISLKQNVFALRGGQIILSQDLFKFQPEETLQRNLEFYYNSEVIENGVLNIEEEMPDVLQITAKSLDNDEVSLTFDLAILDKIDTTNIKLYTREGNSLVEVAAFVQDVEENDFIEIIVNDQNLHKKNLELHFDVADNYIYTLESENDATFIEKQTSVVDGISLFEIQQGKQTSLSEDFLKLNISHKGYEAYVETLKFKVKIKTRPSILKLNGQADSLMVNLFNSDSEENGGSALVSISPTKAEFDYAYIEFYFATEVENELVLTKKTYEEISNYLVITQNDLVIQDNPGGDLKIELANPLEYYGINCTPNDEMIYIKVICESDYAERGTVYNYIKVKVNKAATVFEVDENYENATIYVEKGETVTFTGFKVLDEGAYIGNVYAYPRYGSMGYVNISQTPNTENIVSIDIEALKVGNATYDIMLSSGISTTLNIIVKEKLSIEDFKIYIANTENSDIGEIEYRANETTGVSSLHKISIRGDKEKNKKFVVTPLINPIDADLYTLEISTASPFLTINETELTTLGYTQGEDAVVDVALKLKTIEDFKLVESEEVISYNFFVEIFESIKSFTMTAMNMGDNQGESNYVAVYNETSVGYTDSAMSKVKITTQINPETSKYRKIEWNFSVQSTLETDGVETYYQLRYGNDIGKFYPSTQTFVCDGTNVDAIIGLTFTIIGKVAECGLEYTRSIQIVVREYVAVDRVWLYNHVSHIYLDSIHSEQILYPYVLPTDANNKNLSVWFEPDAGTSSSIVQINYSATEIKINYSGVGSGTGVLHIIPTACFEDSLGNTRYSLDIRVTVARGETEDTPLIISSFEEFLAINTPEGLKKHYLINTVLDASGYDFTTMGEFSGTITGYNIYDTDATFGTNSGSIINLNLTKTDSDGTLALFSSIAPNAKITNFTILGKFNPEQDNISSAAIIAGVNNGLIKNVNVIIEKSSIKTSNVQNFNFGGIVAINNGVVACDIIDYNNVPAGYDDYYYTTNAGQLEKTTNNYLPTTTLMVEMLEGGVKIEATEIETVYVGGIVGQNQGTLIFDWINSFTRYNMYGINTCSYFDVNSTASTMGVGGAAGYNNNIIKNIVAVGEVKANKYVGGLIGHMADGYVENCETRTYVRAKDYVAGLVGIISKGKLSNNKVVAVDDNIRTGFDASLIYISEISTNEIIYNEICNQGDGQILLDNNTAVSYINRDVVNYVEGETDVMFNLNKYYGDIFYQKEPTAKKQFAKAAQIDFLSKIQNTVSLMYYYNAKERQHQQYISAYNIQNLPDDILGVVDIDVTIESYSPLIVVESNGSLRLLGTGYARLRLYNTLNAKDYKDVYIHILNAVTGFEVFANSDYSDSPLSDLSTINVTYRYATVVYPHLTAMLEVGNMAIELVENTELMWEIVDSEYIVVTRAGKTLTIKGEQIATQGGVSTEFALSVYYLDSLGNKWYLTKNGELVKETTQDVGGETQKVKPTETQTKTYKVHYTSGIYEIFVDKTNITVVPSDVISFSVYYRTDDEQDKLNISFQDETNGVIYDLNNEEHKQQFLQNFNFEQSEPKQTDGGYVVNFKLSMNTTNIVTGIYNVKFTSTDGFVKNSLRIEYIEQPIMGVVVKNYSYVQNNNIEEKDAVTNKTIYNTSYTMQESDEITGGKTNILRLYLTPSYSSYAYVDISNNIGNGQNLIQFSLLEKLAGGGAVVSSEGYYNKSGLRVLKSSISDGDLIILYKIPTTIPEGTVLKVDINFYNADGSLAYSTITKELKVVLDKKVQISLDGKMPETLSDGSLFYRVARGYTYRINVEMVGYNQNEITIKSNSQYAKVEKRDGYYYLQISDQINYGLLSGEGFGFTLEAFGTKVIDKEEVVGKSTYVYGTIVEYVINLDVQNLFSSTPLGINVGNTVDIRELAMKNLSVEYAPCAIESVNALKKELIKNAIWLYKLRNEESVEFAELTATTKIEYNQNPTDNQSNVVLIEGFNVTPIVIMENPTYSFGIYADLKYEQGHVKVVAREEDAEPINQDKIFKFDIETKQNTSEEHPWPISTYEELMDMAEDGYYILMKDITLPSDFAPITTKIKSFDGNGYSIKYANVYNYQSIEKFGLFETIEEDCIVKNLTIDVEKTSMFNIDNITADKSIEFGLLTSTNNGMIYNCCVKTQTTSSVKVTFDSSSSSGEKSLVAGVCAINNGYITNSQCKIRIETTGVNIAGFVGQNNNHIANSYQSNCNIRNSSINVNNTTGGFVLYNNGYISGCYISGASSDENLVKVFSDNTGYIVQSSSIVGAFVYSNDGRIEDCYSNIPVVSSTKNSGFVAINNGEISRVYTTSLLGNNDTDNYPFFITNDGEIKDCAYLQDETSKINTNISVTNKNVEGLSALSIKDFNISNLIEMQNSAFKNFVVNSDSLQDSSSQIYIQTGIWFFPGDARNVSASSGYSYKIPYEQFSYMGKAQSFVARRPELVSANLLAYSRKQINEAMTKIDEITGETIYSYTTPANISYASSGTINNPIIIASAAQMEQSLIADPSYAYRLVQNIDYVEEEIIMSNLNKTIFTGHFEGNNLKISNFSINSGDVEVSGGYFAEIGDGSAGNYATVKNIMLCPKYINLPNAFNVGALAGTVNCANVYNVDVDGYTAGLNSADKKGIVVLGRNIVGGVIGRTVNAFDIKDICSSVSANATYAYVGEDIYLTNAYLYSELQGNSNSVSYAGSVIGYVGGSGMVDTPQITNNTVSIALVAGMYFGGIGEDATVQNINATITNTANNYIRVSAYGGVIAGDSLGEIKNINIDYTPSLEDEKLNTGKPFFRESPKIPFAVGGAVGYVRGGKLDNVCSNLPIVSQKVYIVGGLVGKMANAEISNSKIIKYNKPEQESNEPQQIDTIQLQSVYIVGGIVGQVLDAKISEDSKLYNQSKITSCYVGDFKKDGDNVISQETIGIRLFKSANLLPFNNAEDYVTQIYVGGIVGKFDVMNNSGDTSDIVECIFEISNCKVSANIEVRASIYGDGISGEGENIAYNDKLHMFVGGALGDLVVIGENTSLSSINSLISIGVEHNLTYNVEFDVLTAKDNTNKAYTLYIADINSDFENSNSYPDSATVKINGVIIFPENQD